MMRDLYARNVLDQLVLQKSLELRPAGWAFALPRKNKPIASS